MSSKLSRVAAGLVALALAVPSAGCWYHHHHDDDHHDDHHDEPFGTLEVVNDDLTDVIDTIELQDIFDPYHEFFDLGLLPGDSVEFDLFPSTYEVTVYWDTAVITSSQEDIFDDTLLTLFVSN